MPSFWNIVNDVIERADIIIEVLDARMIPQTRNIEVEQKVKESRKTLLYCINKIDLASPEKTKKLSHFLKPGVFISSTQKLGTTILKKKILELSRGKPVIVGIVGYPNVGKSSVINALSGRGAARTSSQSGFTKGIQKVRVDNKIMLLDTPGVFPYGEKDAYKHTLTSSIDAAQLRDPEQMALRFIEDKTALVKKHFQVSDSAIDSDEILEEIAIKLTLFKKDKVPDIIRASRRILQEWQLGKMRED
jgi:ribosome biogenesis GTPase A